MIGAAAFFAFAAFVVYGVDLFFRFRDGDLSMVTTKVGQIFNSSNGNTNSSNNTKTQPQTLGPTNPNLEELERNAGSY